MTIFGIHWNKVFFFFFCNTTRYKTFRILWHVPFDYRELGHWDSSHIPQTPSITSRKHLNKFDSITQQCATSREYRTHDHVQGRPAVQTSQTTKPNPLDLDSVDVNIGGKEKCVTMWGTGIDIYTVGDLFIFNRWPSGSTTLPRHTHVHHVHPKDIVAGHLSNSRSGSTILHTIQCCAK